MSHENLLHAGTIIAGATGSNVTADESAAVLEWCREWCRDVFSDFEDADATDAAVLRKCDRAIDGGLVFVLADVRRVASTDGLDTRYAETPRDKSTVPIALDDHAAAYAWTVRGERTDATVSGDDSAGEDSHNLAADRVDFGAVDVAAELNEDEPAAPAKTASERIRAARERHEDATSPDAFEDERAAQNANRVTRHSAVLAAASATSLDLMENPTAGMPGIIAGQITAALLALADGKTMRARHMVRNAAHNLERLDS